MIYNNFMLEEAKEIGKLIPMKNSAAEEIKSLKKEVDSIDIKAEKTKDAIKENNHEIIFLDKLEDEKLPLKISVNFIENDFKNISLEKFQIVSKIKEKLNPSLVFLLEKKQDLSFLMFQIKKSNENLEKQLIELIEEKSKVNFKINNRENFIEYVQTLSNNFFDQNNEEIFFSVDSEFGALIEKFKNKYFSLNNAGAKSFLSKELENIRLMKTDLKRNQIVKLFKNFTVKKISGLQAWPDKNIIDVMEQSQNRNAREKKYIRQSIRSEAV